jgi:LAGLIDADG DNA endonuclease family
VDLDELIDGLLLGDGGLRRRARSANYTHTCKHREYIEWLQAELSKHGLSFGKIYLKPNGYGSGYDYQIHSRVDAYLTKQHSRWYRNGKKVVPGDLRLSPTSMKHWYIGDGGFDSHKGYLRQICISTHAFSSEERFFLTEQLHELGIKASCRNNGTICIAKSAIVDFLAYIGECPVNCYTYKWNLSIFTSKQPKSS